jgi:hypothetical protein
MDFEPRDDALDRACLGAVEEMIAKCGPSDFFNRMSLEDHRDALREHLAAMARIDATAAQADPPIWGSPPIPGVPPVME